MYLQNKNYPIYKTSFIIVLFKCARDASKYISPKTINIYENSRDSLERSKALFKSLRRICIMHSYLNFVLFYNVVKSISTFYIHDKLGSHMLTFNWRKITIFSPFLSCNPYHLSAIQIYISDAIQIFISDETISFEIETTHVSHKFYVRNAFLNRISNMSIINF